MSESVILTEQHIPLEVAGDLLSVCQANDCYATFCELEDSGLEYCSDTGIISVNDVTPEGGCSCTAQNSYYKHIHDLDIHVDSITGKKLDKISQYTETTDHSVTIGPWTLNMTDDGTGTCTYDVSATYCSEIGNLD